MCAAAAGALPFNDGLRANTGEWSALGWSILRALESDPNPIRPETGPRYEPRSMLKNPRDFGKERSAAFV